MFQLQVRRMIFRIIMMGCLLLLAVARAGADPILIGITGGFLDMMPPNAFFGPLILSGEHGFTLSGGVEASGGNFLPYEQCNVVPLCTSGESVSLRGYWVGSGIAGDVTLDGVTYPHVGDPFGPNSMSVEFAGVVTLPPIADSATVVAPFTFTGSFRHGGPDAVSADLEGLGTTTLSLVRSSFEGADRWRVSEARYDFAPTPEPASLLLVTAGLAGTVLRFRTRQPRRRT